MKWIVDTGDTCDDNNGDDVMLARAVSISLAAEQHAAVPRVLAECYSGISTQSKYLTVDSIYVLPRGLNSSMYPCHVCMHDVRPCEAAAATMQDIHAHLHWEPILEDKVTNIRCPLAETK